MIWSAHITRIKVVWGSGVMGYDPQPDLYELIK